LPPRCCRYCQQLFQPSRYRPDQTVCSSPTCQRQRRAEYHRHRIETDPEYAQVVRDSRNKWRQAHPHYQEQYWRTHEQQAERNRQQQPQRDRKRRLTHLVKNNLALDLKQAAAQIWLVGPAADDLVKNNLASSQLFIFQPIAAAILSAAAS
jgi:hypothetical protein